MVLAVVTGASRGLGFENAKSLAALGYDLVMIAKDSNRLLQAQESLQHNHPGQHFTTYVVDLEDMQAVRNAVEIISQQNSAPDILIQEVVEAFSNHYDVNVEYVETAKENVNFKIPRILREVR